MLSSKSSTVEKKKTETSVTPVIQKICSRIVPGALTIGNKDAIEWGVQSLLAYGCHRHVVVIDTKSIKVFQTLYGHKFDVAKIRWSRETYYHDLVNPYSLRLASADTSGTIIIWNVSQASVRSTLSGDVGRPVSEMSWLTGNDSSHHLLVALYSPGFFVVWNADSGTKIWKKTYSETLLSFSIDPFCESNIAFLASDCILFVNDFSSSKAPTTNGRKFYISSPSNNSGSQLSLNTVGTPTSEDSTKSRPRNLLLSGMRFLIKSDSKSSPDDTVTLNDCLQLMYHRSCRHHLLLLYPKEVLLLDMEIHQTVGIIPLERNGSPFVKMYSCWQRDVLMCLHDSGAMSVRVRRRDQSVPVTVEGDQIELLYEVGYDLRCISDGLRLTKHSKVVGISVCPFSERRLALLISDGRVIFLELISTKQKPQGAGIVPSPLPTPGLNPGSFSDFPIAEKEVVNESTDTNQRPRLALCDMIGPVLYSETKGHGTCLKFLATGLLTSLAPAPLIIKMCPPVTFRNWTSYRPLLAVGNTYGSVQVFNMSTGVMEKEISLHATPVRGIEWVSLGAFLSFASSNLVSSGGQVRNELMLTDVQSGRIKLVRADSNEESPIEMIKVSYLKLYFIICFKDQPFELWDLKNCTLLRTMPKVFPSITALEWSPLVVKNSQRKESKSDKKDLEPIFIESHSSDTFEDHQNNRTTTLTREHFVFTDTDGHLYYFSVEGSVIRHGSQIPPEAGMSSITCIAWKGDQIVLGDADGNLNLWDLKGKVSSGVPTQRGFIKKMKFAPGKGNMKILVLYADGIDIWDVKEVNLIVQARTPKDLPRIHDIDWAGSDKPVLSTSDGCIRIMDMTLKNCTSPVSECSYVGLPFVPHILSPKSTLNLKSVLQHISLPAEDNWTTFIKGQFAPDETLIVECLLNSLGSDLHHCISASWFGIAERCLHVSRLFGDEEECKFWNVALHYLNSSRNSKTAMQSGGDAQTKNLGYGFPLDTAYDFFCNNISYKKLQLERVLLHENKRTTHSHTQRCADNFLLLGQSDRAVQLLLETETENDHFYTDSLRACLIASLKTESKAQSVVKLVATNLIASGRISEGVQLLCLIGKGLDACRYLQAAGEWEKSIWLAKSTLIDEECQEVIKKWSDYLASSGMNQKTKAVLALLTIQQYRKCLELLHNSRMVERAALFLDACLEFEVLQNSSENKQLFSSVWLDYARYLHSVGNRTTALNYCHLVGEAAGDLKKEIEILLEDD